MPASSHEVPVIRIKLKEHPNADQLALVQIDDIRVVGVRKDEWREGDLGAFIQADMVVPDVPGFAWVGSDRRIRPRKFRGLMSWGILVPAPPGLNEGDDAAEALGVTRYEPPIENLSTGGDSEVPPSSYPPPYDLEAYYKYHKLLTPGETVTITEKIRGTNARFTFWDNKMHVGSHRDWKRNPTDKMKRSVYWMALDKYPQIELYCRLHPGHIVYGEIFGDIQDLKYGAEKNEIYFRVFDIRMEGWQWVPAAEVFCCSGMPYVPILYRGPHDDMIVAKLTDGKSAIADHIREGVVIEPEAGRYDSEIGRVKLKAVSMDYLASRK